MKIVEEEDKGLFHIFFSNLEVIKLIKTYCTYIICQFWKGVYTVEKFAIILLWLKILFQY